MSIASSIGSALGSVGGALSFLNPTAALTAGSIGLNAAGSVYQAKQNRASAKDQMNFQREMSNTSYQRQMKDLRNAGLNPILAAKIGGASTPQGAGYQTPNIGAAATQGAHSALQTANLYQQNQVLQKQATAAGIENDFLLKEPWAVPAKMLQGMSAAEIAAFKLWWEATQQNNGKISIKDALSGALDSSPPGITTIEIKGDKNSKWNPHKKKTIN